ncbi:MAG TPA: nuclear transport factor 2 family protein [Solirubrobacteraceae bacterium]|nr:nuclear transport factor 2 family protein [Solirubrobacteraceae bacterium]
MTDIDSTIEKWVASWNEPDSAARRSVIDEIWAADGVYRNARTEFNGRSGIEDAVTQAYDAFSANGFVFRVAGVDANHDAVRYRWEMIPTAGGEPDSIGTHVAMVGMDGRFVSDHQFIDEAPSGR